MKGAAAGDDDAALPVTERTNELSLDIDECGDALGVVRVMRSVDAQMYSGRAAQADPRFREHRPVSSFDAEKDISSAFIFLPCFFMSSRPCTTGTRISWAWRMRRCTTRSPNSRAW